MGKFEMLFRPIKVKKMEIVNRVGMPSMHLNFTPGGEITEKFIAFYRERAKGEVGLIVIGGCSINKTAGGPILVGLHDDSFLPGLKKFTEEIHRASETKVAAQLYHAGRYAFSFLIGEQAVAPSAVASRLTKEMPRELTVEEIKQLEDDFAEAAERAERAGFDAVELLGSAGYIISQFLSPLTNLRNDEYGGSLENRVRFGVEIIKKVREAVGEDYPIILRQGGSDFMRGGNTSKDILEAVKYFADAGVDLINVTGGWHETHVPQITGAVPRAGYAYLAQGIRKVTGKPVIISNRLATLNLAERLLREGWGDMVNFGRPLIADPYIVKKAKDGKLEDIRPCIACNQLCFDAVFMGQEVGCTVNPFAGKESEITDDTLPPASEKKKVVIVGGGAGGMSAAITAAERGHDVVVFEKKPEIGGQLEVASAPPDKREFARLIEYYKIQASQLGIDLRTSTKATEEMILKENPDEVIIATGGTPIIPPIPGINLPHVLKAEDVLKGNAILGDRIVIIGGGAVGVDVGLFLVDRTQINGDQTKFLLKWEAEDCRRVTELAQKSFKEIIIVEMLEAIGRDIGKSTRWVALKELSRAGVKMLTKTTAREIKEDGVKVESEAEGEYLIPADTVITAVGYKPSNELFEKLKEKMGEKVHIIGDAKKVRKLQDAIHEGFKIALTF